MAGSKVLIRAETADRSSRYYATPSTFFFFFFFLFRTNKITKSVELLLLLSFRISMFSLGRYVDAVPILEKNHRIVTYNFTFRPDNK